MTVPYHSSAYRKSVRHDLVEVFSLKEARAYLDDGWEIVGYAHHDGPAILLQTMVEQYEAAVPNVQPAFDWGPYSPGTK